MLICQFWTVAERERATSRIILKFRPLFAAIGERKGRDAAGKPYTVRYEAVNAMLLNEFLKEHRKVEAQAAINHRQEAAIAQQQKEIAALTAALNAQAAQVQKVSDQLKAQASNPRVVAND